MKKYLLSILLIVTLVGAAFGASLSPYAFPFIGKWNPSESPLLLDNYGLQDIQNLRKDGKHFKGVSGHTAINTIYVSGASNTYPWVLNGFHFRKDQPSESHVLIMAGEYFQTEGELLADGRVLADGEHRAGSFLVTLLQDETVIPGEGDFSAEDLYTPLTFDETWQFCSAPGGNVIISNGGEALIWGGDEIEATSFITSSSTVAYTLTDANDYSAVLNNNSQATDQLADLTAAGSGTFLVGSKRPLQGIKLYVLTENDTASTLTGKEWTGAAWTALAITDNTESAAPVKTLFKTGTVTWDYTGNAVPRYINGLSLYWYQFTFDAGSTTLYYVTADAPVQPIRNIWDGVEGYAVKFLKYDGTTYKDYTDNVSDGYLSTYADLSSLDTTDAVYIGFFEPQQAITLTFDPGKENTTVTAMTVKYWSGTAWVATPSFNDGTKTGTTSLSKGGVITWQSPGYGVDIKRAISDEFPLYYYQLTFSVQLDDEVQVGEVTGAAYPPAIPPYKFSKTFQGRSFLFNEMHGSKNKATYSVINSPDIWNGSDSGEIIFGDRTDLTAATVVYNVFTDTATEQLLITKKNETWRLSGDTSDYWTLKRISPNIGCIAPLSMVSAEVMDSGTNQKRTVAIWVSDKGPVMSTGAAVIPIYDDIRCYWNPNDLRYISPAMQTRSVGQYDPYTRSYKLLIGSGSTATYLNTELEFSLLYNEWTKIYRENATGANPLQSIWPVWDTNGVGYPYGGGKDGFVYRLENGNDWNGVADITSYIHTKDLMPDNDMPMFRKSTVKYLRTIYEKKDVGDITITHYGDGDLTTSGVNGQAGPAIITNAASTDYNTQSCNLGSFLYHSFKFSATTDVADGLELTGFGLYSDQSPIMR